jgi:capsular exopolysaccharide synthesis family protein
MGVDRLGLTGDPEFAGRPGLLDRFSPGTAQLSAEGLRERTLRAVQKRTSVVRVGSTYVIDIKFEAEDPHKAARIANAFADGYLFDQRQAKINANRQASEWLQTRIGQLRGQVQTAEAAAAQYRITNNLMTAAGENLTDQEISSYNQQAALARAAAAEAESRLRAARTQLGQGSSGDALGEALGSVVIQNLRSQRAQVSAKLANLETRYGPRHPELVTTQKELADLDSQIQAEVARIISSLQTNAAAARERLASIESSVGQARATLADNNRAGIQLSELERNAQAVRSLYESFLARYKEISSQEGIATADAKIVSYSSLPNEPTSPNIPTNLAIGLTLAAALGVAGVLLSELLDSTLSTSDDVQRRLFMPYLGAVPLLGSVSKGRGSPISHVVSAPSSAFSEAIRAVGASILFSPATPPKIVLMTSALPGEGKTMASLCLVRSLAMQGHRVLYVDCDLRRAAGAAALGVRPVAGLIEVLKGDVSLSTAIFKDVETGADILPMRPPASGSRDLFSLPAMDQLLERLRGQYELVILDTAPVLAVSETRVLARKADAVVVLAAWRQTPQKAVENALEMLEAVGAQVVGVALTQVDLKAQMKTGYGDPAVYFRQYSAYYSNERNLPVTGSRPLGDAAMGATEAR